MGNGMGKNTVGRKSSRRRVTRMDGRPSSSPSGGGGQRRPRDRPATAGVIGDGEDSQGLDEFVDTPAADDDLESLADQYVASVSGSEHYQQDAGQFNGSFSYYSVTRGEETGAAVPLSEDGYYKDDASRAGTAAAYDRSAPEEPPVTVTEWQRGELLGQGSFGKVYLGLCTDTGMLMAVKQVEITTTEPDGSVGEELRTLQQEINVIRDLRHENIVRYYGTAVARGFLNIFLEYVPGGSLRSLIQRFGKLNESLVRVYTRQILEGLDYLHRRRVIHRDIKGANILVDDKGRIKLADFGASRTLTNLVSLSEGLKSVRGSPYWMAPEVIKQSGYGRQADIWSVGCVVIEMAMGEPPFSRYKTQISALFHIASTEELPDLPDDFSDLAIDFLCQCFRRDARERPNATQLLAHPWLAEEPASPAVQSRRSLSNESKSSLAPQTPAQGTVAASPKPGYAVSPTTPGLRTDPHPGGRSFTFEDSDTTGNSNHDRRWSPTPVASTTTSTSGSALNLAGGTYGGSNGSIDYQHTQQQQQQYQSRHGTGNNPQPPADTRAPQQRQVARGSGVAGHSVSKSTVDEFIRHKVETDAARMVRSIRESVEMIEARRAAGPQAHSYHHHHHHQQQHQRKQKQKQQMQQSQYQQQQSQYQQQLQQHPSTQQVQKMPSFGSTGSEAEDEVRERERKREEWEREIREAMAGDDTRGGPSASVTKSKGRAVRSGRGKQSPAP